MRSARVRSAGGPRTSRLDRTACPPAVADAASSGTAQRSLPSSQCCAASTGGPMPEISLARSSCKPGHAARGQHEGEGRMQPAGSAGQNLTLGNGGGNGCLRPSYDRSSFVSWMSACVTGRRSSDKYRFERFALLFQSVVHFQTTTESSRAIPTVGLFSGEFTFNDDRVGSICTNTMPAKSDAAITF